MKKIVRVAVIWFLVAVSAEAQWITKFDVDSGRPIDDAFFLWVGKQPEKFVKIVVQRGRRVELSTREKTTFTVAAVADLPDDAFLWDIRSQIGDTVASIVAVTPKGLAIVECRAPEAPPSVKFHPLAIDLFRGRPTGPPLRYALFGQKTAQTGDVFLPTLSGILHVRLKEDGTVEEIERVPLSAKSTPKLGWGLGYRIEARLTPSFVAAGDWNSDGRDDLLVRGEKSFLALVEKDGRWQAAAPVAPAPSAESAKILDFDYRVAPLVGDFDGDGVVDWLLTDPGNGLQYAYFGRGRLTDAAPRQPDQVMKESGWSIGRIVIDADGDGRFDLMRLSIAQLNLLEQVQVLRKNVLPLRATFHPMTKDGSFAERSAADMRVEMPIALSITRTKRTVNFRAPLVCGRDGREMRVLGPGEKGGALFRWTDDGAVEVKSIDLTVDRKSFYARPFDPPTTDCNNDGIDDFLFLIKSPEDGRDRVSLLLSGIP